MFEKKIYGAYPTTGLQATNHWPANQGGHMPSPDKPSAVRVLECAVAGLRNAKWLFAACRWASHRYTRRDMPNLFKSKRLFVLLAPSAKPSNCI